MRKHLIIVLVATFGLFLGTNGFTQETKGTGVGDTANKTAEGQPINAFMVKKIIGSKVINAKGETLGTIGDLVVDIDSGKIMYVVLESGGFLGIGDKLLPVPWESLGAIPLQGIFFLHQTKEHMENAPGVDKDNLPNMGDTHWGEGILKHYGVSGYERRGPSYGYGYGYGGYYGYPTQPGSERENPYEKLFDSKTIKTISGQVIKVDQVPGPGFGTEMRLTVFIAEQEVLTVYLGPAFYIVSAEQAERFKIGNKVIVTGSQVTVRGEPFIIATTVKRGNEVLRLRDEDGTPKWVAWKKSE